MTKADGKNEIVSGTCLTDSEVRDIASHYNANNKNLEGEEKTIDISILSVDQILDELHARLGSERGYEYKWINSGVVSPSSAIGARLKDAFRPMMPKSWIRNDRTWLSNFDIQAVMCQYDDVFPDFWFVGVFSMDFAHILTNGQCVSMDMCGLDVSEMKRRRKSHAGIVLNLDKHDQSGSHWVALYINIDSRTVNYGCFYYDSTARPTPEEVNVFTHKIKTQVLESRENDVFPFRIKENRVKRQFKNTECGIFTMFFLVCCMSREFSFQTICDSMGNDDDLHTLRTVFFRPPNA